MATGSNQVYLVLLDCIMDPITLHRSFPLNMTTSPLFCKSILLFLCVVIGVLSCIKDPTTTFKDLKVSFINHSLDVLNNPAPQSCLRIGTKISVPHSCVCSAQMFWRAFAEFVWMILSRWMDDCMLDDRSDGSRVSSCVNMLARSATYSEYGTIQISVAHPQMWYEVQYIGNFCTA